MNRMMLAALALTIPGAAAPAHRPPAAAADRAGNRMLALPAPAGRGTEDAFARHCTTDRHWCARLSAAEGEGIWRLELSEGAGPARRIDVAGPHDEESQFAIWPRIVIEASGAVLVGVEATRTTGYSGGGASATRLVLVRAKPGGGALRQMLDVPLRAMKDIRACFGPRDMRHRRNACSDQYEFYATLTLDPATRTGRPHFLYAAGARTYPGHISADSDSTTARPLRPSDLRWWIDPVCTYRRRIAFDPGGGAYLPDRALPDCSDYLDI